MAKKLTFAALALVLGAEIVRAEDGSATLTEDQLKALDKALSERDEVIGDLNLENGKLSARLKNEADPEKKIIEVDKKKYQVVGKKIRVHHEEKFVDISASDLEKPENKEILAKLIKEKSGFLKELKDEKRD
jgi:hypothetical protein